MAITSLKGVFQRLGWAGSPEAGLDDGLLLTAFIDRREPAAFEALVQRHGPMVLGVCRRILGHDQDAEDAFQAAFLVLARRADVIRPRDLVGNWLYGVAYRTALQARAVSARRRSREMPVENLPEPPTIERDPWLDLQPVLDEEVNRLPEHYRAAVVLCELEGRSRADVARLLSIPEGTLSSRLAAARKLLAERLTRRGLALPAGGLAALIPMNAATAAVPLPLLGTVVQAAFAASVTEAAAAGLVSAPAAILANGVMKAMFLSKLKVLSLWVVGLGITATGAGLMAERAVADGPKPAVEKPGVKPAEGDKPRNPNAPRDGVKPAGVRDGVKPVGVRDGDKPKTGARDGDKPKPGPRDGDKPTTAAGGKGEAITMTGTVSKSDVKRKRDDGTETTTSAYFLTESSGNRVALPGPRVTEAGKTLDSFNLADFVGKSVTVTGRGYTTKSSEGADTGSRVVKVIALSDVKDAK